MNLIVVPSGYMGSGSSAITDIVSEIKGFEAKNESYEYVFLHAPDGLFDLEDKLLFSNNALRSDEALFRFEERMKSLYNKKNFWVGSYNHFISYNFINYVYEFIDRIVNEEYDDTYWYFQQEPMSVYMQGRLYFRRLVKMVTGGKVLIKVPLRYKTMRTSFPSETEFYSASKCFLNKVMADLGINESNIILDQLLLPHNLFRIDHYFDDNLRVFVVERDPRDVFLLNKYVWRKDAVSVPYPYDAERFCDYYRRMRKGEKVLDDKRILRYHFEDFIYNYDDSISKIYDFLNVSEEMHDKKKKKFNPDISVNNTQLFRIKGLSEEVLSEVKIIETRLRDYLYDFPETEFQKERISLLF